MFFLESFFFHRKILQDSCSDNEPKELDPIANVECVKLQYLYRYEQIFNIQTIFKLRTKFPTSPLSKPAL